MKHMNQGRQATIQKKEMLLELGKIRETIMTVKLETKRVNKQLHQ